MVIFDRYINGCIYDVNLIIGELMNSSNKIMNTLAILAVVVLYYITLVYEFQRNFIIIMYETFFLKDTFKKRRKRSVLQMDDSVKNA